MHYSELDSRRYAIYEEFPLLQEDTGDLKLRADVPSRDRGNPNEGEQDDYHSKS